MPVIIIAAVDGAAINWLTRLVLDALAAGELITPAALALLLQQYVATGRADVRDALGPALAQSIDSCAQKGLTAGADERAEWLMVLVEAEAIADDDRVHAAAESVMDALHEGWPGRGRVRSSMQSIDACLRGAVIHANRASVIAAAIDELERVVSMSYEPGEGLAAHVQSHSRDAGNLRDHVAAASALLTAYQATARLPYSMLAEELMQFARRSWWDDEAGSFARAQPDDGASADADQFLGNAEAARVLCRLTALHQDPEYRAVAVIAHASDYGSDTRRTLEALAPLYRDRGLQAALYGVALSEWLAAESRIRN